MNLLKNIHDSRQELAEAGNGESRAIRNEYGFVPGMDMHNQICSVRYLTKTEFGYGFSIDMDTTDYLVFDGDTSGVKFLAFVAQQLRMRPSLFGYVNKYKNDLYNWFVVSFIHGHKVLPAAVSLSVFDAILKKEAVRAGKSV